MTPKQREAVLLKASGESLGEVAKSRGMSLSALRMLTYDGAKRAAKALGMERPKRKGMVSYGE